MAMYLGSNKVEIGQSSGGGSSDFSTAEVTFTSSGDSYSVMGYEVSDNSPITLTFPLFEMNDENHSKAFCIPASLTEGIQSMPTTTGDVLMIDEGFLIQGDGTVTL